jgi:4'-phosphopantetheinyl transferase
LVDPQQSRRNPYILSRHAPAPNFMAIAWRSQAEILPLLPDELHVWSVEIGAAGSKWSRRCGVLTPDERARAGEFRLEAPRRRFVVARSVLRLLLGSYLATPPAVIELAVDPHGKPRLANRGRRTVHFNVAHSADLALIALAQYAVGVDVEAVRAVSHADHIARRYFHPHETHALTTATASERDELFMRCWTCKEAVLKAIGIGVTGSLASFEVPTRRFDAAWIELPSSLVSHSPRCWLHELMPAARYVGAVACVGKKLSLRCFKFDTQQALR